MTTKNTKKDRYAQLDNELKVKQTQFRDYHELKRLVITADATANLAHIPKYLNVANELGLSNKGRNELQDLYSEFIDLLNVRFFIIRSQIIGYRGNFGLGRNISPETKPSEESKNSAIKDLLDFIVPMVKSDELKDRDGIKAVVIYPLTIAVVNTWRKFDNEFAGKIIDAIKANENNENLKRIIEMIDIPVIARR